MREDARRARPAPRPPARRRPLEWIGLGAATLACGYAVEAAGLPSGYLFAGVVVGFAFSFAVDDRLRVGERPFGVAQAVAGVALGSLVSSSALAPLRDHFLPVVLVAAAVLALTVASGLALARIAAIEPTTASLGMIAGGASGIVAMADQLGADERLVAFLQYQRVLVVTVLTSLLAPLLFGAQEGLSPPAAPILGEAGGWAIALAAAAAGAALGPLLRLPAPLLLGPLLLTAALALAGVFGEIAVPPLATDLAFVTIGLRIGLGFDRATLRAVGRLALPGLAIVVAILAVCFGLGLLLAEATGTSHLDGYLATTPGGLFAVLPIVYGSDVNTTFVLGVQILRLLTMILAAPFLVRWLHGPPPPRAGTTRRSRRRRPRRR